LVKDRLPKIIHIVILSVIFSIFFYAAENAQKTFFIRDGSRVALQEKAQRMIVEFCALATNLDSEFAQAFRELLNQ